MQLTSSLVLDIPLTGMPHHVLSIASPVSTWLARNVTPWTLPWSSCTLLSCFLGCFMRPSCVIALVGSPDWDAPRPRWRRRVRAATRTAHSTRRHGRPVGSFCWYTHRSRRTPRSSSYNVRPDVSRCWRWLGEASPECVKARRKKARSTSLRRLHVAPRDDHRAPRAREQLAQVMHRDARLVPAETNGRAATHR
jgi:hypothetical protein